MEKRASPSTLLPERRGLDAPCCCGSCCVGHADSALPVKAAPTNTNEQRRCKFRGGRSQAATPESMCLSSTGSCWQPFSSRAQRPDLRARSKSALLSTFEFQRDVKCVPVQQVGLPRHSGETTVLFASPCRSRTFPGRRCPTATLCRATQRTVAACLLLEQEGTAHGQGSLAHEATFPCRSNNAEPTPQMHENGTSKQVGGK